MFGSRRQALFACVTLTVLFGAGLHGVGLRTGGLGAAGGRHDAAALIDTAPAAAAVDAFRPRTAPSGEADLTSRRALTPAGVALTATGLVAAALAGWWFTRRERGTHVALPRRSPATLRAPPAIVG
ncbi:MAG TPA: hypothetical protein VKB57_25430 [Acidimicrobiales bacterium]|nr:hypothetical protein [Acidimicrobiales bacterium]